MINGTTSGMAAALQDMSDAIDKTPGGWEWIKSFSDSEDKSFMLCNDPKKMEIMGNMKFLDNHSGASLACMFRTMEFIAKHGWDAYVKNG